MTPYDGKAFVITTPHADDEGHYLGGWLAPADGSLPARRIMSCVHGYQYSLDDGSGKAENAIVGPWVGDEINTFLRRTGGCPASENQPALEPEEGFVVAQIFQPCVPVTGGPNAGPDLVVKPVVLDPKAPDVPVDPAVAAATTKPATPVAEPLPATVDHPTLGTIALVPAATVQAHKSLMDELRAEASSLADHTAAGIHKAVAKLEQVWSKWSHL